MAENFLKLIGRRAKDAIFLCAGKLTTMFHGASATGQQQEGNATMAKFYDVKLKKSVERPVVDKKEYGEEGHKRYALKGLTEDGRPLTAFCSKEVYDKTKVKK